MPATKRSTKRLRTERLETALTEQARLGEAFDRSIGTTSEQAAYTRLRAATLDVSRRDRDDKAN